jgi:rfaE bifunctional protein nucleotidyltransferase chain/domain
MKIVSREMLVELTSTWRAQNKSIVFTNGCFDILHFGHIAYLSKARSLGDKLIIGINSDNSVNRLKGKGRPIQDEISRAIVISALEMVDAVVIFEEDNPFELIKAIVPDVLVKGGDWEVQDIIGSDIVLKNGGKVMSLSYEQGYSTTAIERKIKDNPE